jgi:hypothetical protein
MEHQDKFHLLHFHLIQQSHLLLLVVVVVALAVVVVVQVVQVVALEDTMVVEQAAQAHQVKDLQEEVNHQRLQLQVVLVVAVLEVWDKMHQGALAGMVVLE